MPHLRRLYFASQPLVFLVGGVLGTISCGGGDAMNAGSGGQPGSGGQTSGGSGNATGAGGTNTGSGGTAAGVGGAPPSSSGGAPGAGGGPTGSGGRNPATGGMNAGSPGGVNGAGGMASGMGGQAGGTAGSPGGGGGAGAGAAGSNGIGGAPPSCTAAWIGDARRPQLTDASALCYSVRRTLAQTGIVGALVTDNWDPTPGLPSAATLTPMFTVAADGTGTHTTIQSAITAAKATLGGARVYVLVKPGTYRELVCVDGTVPITLYGGDADASRVTIVFDNYSGKAVDAGRVNACSDPTKSTPVKTAYGTSDSTTVFVKANGFQAMNLTITNDTDEIAAGNPSAIQAVALTTQGDQGVFQNIRVRGNQDTLQVKTAAATNVARSYFKGSFIEGDTDFIFGRGTAVFDGCTITYVAGRKTNSTHIAPSTETPVAFGFLIINSRILGAAGISGTTLLGRAWDDSSGAAPNGHAIIRNTEIGNQINVAAPWGIAASSNRPFDPASNRLYEYKNTGAGAGAVP